MKLRDYIEQHGYKHTPILGDVLLGALESRSIGSHEEAKAMLDVEMHELLEKLGIAGRISVEHVLQRLRFISRMSDDLLIAVHNSREPLSLGIGNTLEM